MQRLKQILLTVVVIVLAVIVLGYAGQVDYEQEQLKQGITR